MPKYRIHYTDGTSKVLFYRSKDALHESEINVAKVDTLNGIIIQPSSGEQLDEGCIRSMYDPSLARGWSRYK